MAECLLNNPLPLYEHLIRRRVVLLLLVLFLAACGSLDYTVKPRSSLTAVSNNDIGIVRFHFTDSTEGYEVRMRRIKGGYALQTPLYGSPEQSSLYFSTSYTRESDYSIGIRGSYSF